MCPLVENFMASYRDLEKRLKECKDTLPPELITQLKRALYYHSITMPIDRITLEQRMQACFWSNHSSISKKIKIRG